MITTYSKSSPDTQDRIATFVYENRHLTEQFSPCKSRDEVTSALKQYGDQISVLITERPIAIFSLTTTETSASIDCLCPERLDTLNEVVSGVQSELRKRRISEVTVVVPEGLADALSNEGFVKQDTLLRLSGKVTETRLMPLLPLSNPSAKDVPALAALMYESYSKSGDSKIQSASSAEKTLTQIISGYRGTYLADSSFVSIAGGKIVSACLITSYSGNSASIVELFTHPLYRARGLATTVIASGMNRLSKRGVSLLSVRIGHQNEVARRLLGKFGFSEDRRLIVLTARMR